VKQTLVIGYGNTLRGDDGAGVCAAERLAERFPDLDVLTVHELQPELAETISTYREVFFLDAGMDVPEVRAEVVTPAADSRPDGSHSHSPGTLLSLCSALYGRAPERSLLVAIPGQSFDFSEQLSPFTEAMVERAVEQVGHLLSP
jgi:hydrogenase maturation protease